MTIEDIDLTAAARRISPYIHKTPILSSSGIDSLTGATILFKCENLQKTGSFKARGATNNILMLSEQERAQGVVTHSSGNHGQALAWAAARNGVKAFIIMPENAPRVKVEAVKSYGAEVIFCASNLEAREEKLMEVQEQTKAVFIPPYDHYRTIEGAASCALELLDEQRDLDVLLAPVGGGGLLSGTILGAKAMQAGLKVIGCEPEEAKDAWESLKNGERVLTHTPNTMADGLRTTLGAANFPIIRDGVEDILLCSERSIVEAMKLIWERMKLVVEPSGAVPLACLLEHPKRFEGLKVGIIISGGNIDLTSLPF